MRVIITYILFLASIWGFAQDTFVPKKSAESEINIDGVLAPNEWQHAVEIPLDIEFSPANNETARKETIAYVTYSDLYLFIGVYAKDNRR